MGKFAVKIERVITIALILSMMLILIPGVSVQAKAKKCNHKSVTWITTSKSSCTDEGMKVKKCKNCGKILKIKKPFHQFHGITGREAGRTVKKLLQRFVQ